MLTTSLFLQFWNIDRARNALLSCLDRDDLVSMRLVCCEFGQNAAPLLFKKIRVTFRSTTFTRHARMAALKRIGYHIKSLHFIMPHTSETFLAPLIDSDTGEAVTFVYEPFAGAHNEPTSRLSLPCYGSWEMTDLLVRQYPPLFHAAANVPSFVSAVSALTCLSHLLISCPSEELGQGQRRSIVDYALISLRIAIERNKLSSLRALSLLDVHPTATLYLNPGMGFGALPNSRRKWNQIRDLRIQMRSVSRHGVSTTDHLKQIHLYLNMFTPNLKRLDFLWLGERGPHPLVLTTEPEMKIECPPSACPSTHSQGLEPLRFDRLRHLRVENTITEAAQLARFITRHHRAVRNTKRIKLQFNNTTLRTGTWDEALEPLTQLSGSDDWKSSSEDSGEDVAGEFMDVPIMFSSIDERQNELHKVWNDHVNSRSFRPHYSGLNSLQRAGARTRELLFGAEEHMRKIFSSTVFCWR